MLALLKNALKDWLHFGRRVADNCKNCVVAALLLVGLG